MTYVELSVERIMGRYAVAIGSAFAITASLLFIMQAAIAHGDITYDPVPNLPTVEMVPKMDDEPITRRDRQVPKPPPPDKMPEPPKLQRTLTSQTGTPLVVPEPKPVIGPVKHTSGTGEGDLMPIMTVAPDYPQRALSRGVEGWVIVEFIVDELGRVIAPRVIDAQPTGVFDRSALKAVLRYKYKPRVVNGESLPVHGVRQRIVFELS